jgi:hypothetical protein
MMCLDHIHGLSRSKFETTQYIHYSQLLLAYIQEIDIMEEQLVQLETYMIIYLSKTIKRKKMELRTPPCQFCQLIITQAHAREDTASTNTGYM